MPIPKACSMRPPRDVGQGTMPAVVCYGDSECKGNLRVLGPITLLILYSKSWDLEGSSLGLLWMYSITQTLRWTFHPLSRATCNLSGWLHTGPTQVLFVCTRIPLFIFGLFVFVRPDNVPFVRTLFGSHIAHLVYSLPSPGRRSSDLLSLDLLCQVCT